MRIGIDARFFGNTGGIARYVQQLILGLEQLDHVNEYVIFLRRENWDSYTPQNPRFSKYLSDVSWYGLKEQIIMPLHFKRAGVNLMHFPHWNIPLFYRKPFVVTIHDLILLHYPSTRATTRSKFIYLFKQWFFHRVLNHAVKKALHILVPSEYTKKDIEKILNISSKKITVTYEGVNIPILSQTEKESNDFLNTLGIQRPYVLYVGVAYPHKNLEWLIQAISAYNLKHSANLHLVLVGSNNYFYKRIKLEFKKFIHNGMLVLTDFVPDSQLGILFKHASAYIFPSLYEGFGLPPLQACAAGLPVLSSDSTCLPEILDDAALFFDPTNTEDFLTKLNIILNDTNTREKLIQNGLKRYQQFSWLKMAEMSLRVYQK